MTKMMTTEMDLEKSNMRKCVNRRFWWQWPFANGDFFVGVVSFLTFFTRVTSWACPAESESESSDDDEDEVEEDEEEALVEAFSFFPLDFAFLAEGARELLEAMEWS